MSDTTGGNASAAVLSVEVSESDLSRSELDRLKTTAAGTEVLGARERLSEVANELIMRVAVRKLEALAPEGFQLSELEMSVKIEGKLFGSGVSGEVKAKMIRKT